MLGGNVYRFVTLLLLILTVQGSALRGTTNASTAATCEPIELRPGFPEYRGLVPGISASSDVVCRAELETAYPGFSVASENLHNVSAARRLGISGDPEDWTWEIWMAIEAERGLPATCYSCIWVNGTTIIGSRNSNRDDPRTNLGLFGQKKIVTRFLIEHDLPRYYLESAPTDDQMRALLGMLNLGRYLTASELLDGYDRFLSGIYVTYDGGIDPQLAFRNALSQGGYAPTPGNAAPEDQLFMILEAAAALDGTAWPREITSTILNRILKAYDYWEVKGLGEVSFAEWLRGDEFAGW